MRPPVWQLVREASEHFAREVTYAELKQFIWSKHPDVNDGTINCQITVSDWGSHLAGPAWAEDDRVH
jgi:hypothetical protein